MTAAQGRRLEHMAAVMAVAAAVLSAWFLLSPLPGFYSGSALRPHRIEPPLSGLNAPSAALLPTETDPAKQRRELSGALAIIAVFLGAGAVTLHRRASSVSDGE